MPFTLYWTAAATFVAGAISSSQASGAARDAATAQSDAAAIAAREQRAQQDLAAEQAAPFRQAGLSALSQQQALLGLSGQAEQQQAFQAFEDSPGQQFIRQRQQRALLQNTAAIGGLGGGNVRGALQQQAAGFAQQDFQNQLNRLGGLAGQGQIATANVAQLGAGAAQQIGQFGIQAGQAQASGILGAQQAQGRFTSQLGGGIRGAGFASQTPGVTTQQGFLAGFR